jgi:hypothetical protein
MELVPRPTIDDGLIEGRPCFVCGEHSLKAVHVEGVPDYVSCPDCHSAFVLDQTGDWLMYGMISQAYPETRRAALRQWVRPEDVLQSAAEDRRLVAVAVAEAEAAALETPEPAPAELTFEALAAPVRDESPLPADLDSVVADDRLRAIPLPLPPLEEAPVEEAPGLQAHVAATGVPLEGNASDFDDFSARLAALAGVPIEDILFDADDEAFAGEGPIAEVARQASSDQGLPEETPLTDDWLILPEETNEWHPPAETAAETGEPDSLRSLWRAKPEGVDVFALSPLAGQGEAAEPVSLMDRLAPPAAAVAVGKTADAASKPEPQKEDMGTTGMASSTANEPPAGIRYRTVIRGNRVQFPRGTCAHCAATPARRRLSVPGSLPAGQTLGQRRATRFAIPICASCHRRASARTPEEKSARQQAYLISALVALFVLIVTLLLDVINLEGGGLVSGLLLLIILVLGYAIPALMLAGRANRFLPPVDALYVQTTLLVPEETQGLETAFEWRSKAYAERFLEANQEAVLGRAIQVKDRSDLPT